MPLLFVLAGVTAAVAAGCEDEDGSIFDAGAGAGRLDGAAGMDAPGTWTDAGGSSADAPGVSAEVDTGNDVASDMGEDRGGSPGTDVASDGGAWDPGPAHCQQGTVRSFASNTDAVQAMAGRWKYCGGYGASAFKDEAIEFTADGQWFQLEPDATGALVRQMSLGKAGQFSLTPTATTPTTAFTFLMTYNNTGSSYGTNLALTADPRRLQLGPDYLMPAE